MAIHQHQRARSAHRTRVAGITALHARRQAAIVAQIIDLCLTVIDATRGARLDCPADTAAKVCRALRTYATTVQAVLAAAIRVHRSVAVKRHAQSKVKTALLALAQILEQAGIQEQAAKQRRGIAYGDDLRGRHACRCVADITEADALPRLYWQVKR